MSRAKSIISIISILLVLVTVLGCSAEGEKKKKKPAKTLPDQSSTVSQAQSSSQNSSSNVSSTKPVYVPPIPEDTSKRGNTAGNLINSGTAAFDGEWIYYSTVNGLYKVKGDDGEPIQLYNGVAYYINVYDGWIYFTDISESYRIRTNGQDFQKMGQKAVRVDVVDGYVYHIVWQYGIIRTDLNGGNGKLIIDSKSINPSNITITSERIYWGDNIDTYEANIDGSDIRCYEDACSQGMLIYKGKKYTSGCLEKGNLIDTEQETLVKNGAMDINIQDDWVYYVNANDCDSIYKIRIDGTDNQKINNRSATNLNVAGDWVFFYDIHVRQSYKMKLDGTEFQKI